jgi:ATP-dependent Lon protease
MVENENNNSNNENNNNENDNKKSEKDLAQILGELKDKAAEILNSDVELEVEIQPDSKNGKKTGKSGRNRKSELVPADDFLPAKLPIIPLQGHPIFPGIFTPLMINNSGDIKAAEEAYEGDGYLGIVMLKNDVADTRYEDLYKVGTAAKIIKKINLPDGGINVFISTVKRFKMTKCLSSSAPIVAAVNYLEEEENDTFEVKALTRALISEMKEVAENNPLFTEEMRLNMVNIDNPGKITDFIASILNVDKEDQQRVLETLNVRQRMEQVLVFIKKEQELLRVQKKIQNDINEKVEKNQRDYFLREELKSIQEELGTDAEGNLSDYQKYKKEIEKFNFTGEIKESLESELEKFKILDTQSPEYTVSRNYLDLVCQLPWNEEIKVENYSLESAKKLLDGDHY